MEASILITDRQAIKEILKEAINEFEKERKTGKPLLFSIHKVAQILKRSDRTIKNLIKTGAMQATADGKITETALNEYLSKK